MKSRPTEPLRKVLNRESPGAFSVSGEVPRAFAITLVLPKKSLSICQLLLPRIREAQKCEE